MRVRVYIRGSVEIEPPDGMIQHDSDRWSDEFEALAYSTLRDMTLRLKPEDFGQVIGPTEIIDEEAER